MRQRMSEQSLEKNSKTTKEKSHLKQQKSGRHYKQRHEDRAEKKQNKWKSTEIKKIRKDDRRVRTTEDVPHTYDGCSEEKQNKWNRKIFKDVTEEKVPEIKEDLNDRQGKGCVGRAPRQGTEAGDSRVPCKTHTSRHVAECGQK